MNVTVITVEDGHSGSFLAVTVACFAMRLQTAPLLS
jgi:hypothetical protein